jgi:hypothetical protein
MTTSTSIPTAIHPADLADAVPDGIRLDVRLVVADPDNTVGPDLRAALTRHKPILVEAVGRAIQLGLGPDGWRRVLTLDRQGFDWAHGRQGMPHEILRTEGGHDE